MKEIILSDGRKVTIDTQGNRWDFAIKSNSGEVIDEFSDDPSKDFNSEQMLVERAALQAGMKVGMRLPKGGRWLQKHVDLEADLTRVAREVTSIFLGGLQDALDQESSPSDN